MCVSYGREEEEEEEEEDPGGGKAGIAAIGGGQDEREAEVITEREPLVAPGACVQIRPSSATPPPRLPVQSTRFHLSWNTAPGGYRWISARRYPGTLRPTR